MNEFLAAVIAEASALGLVWWERVALILALSIIRVGGQVVFLGALKFLHGKHFPPEWDPEKGTGNLSPPMDMPPGGMPVPGPGDRWNKGDP